MVNSQAGAWESGNHFLIIMQIVMPECFYRASIVSEKMDSRQKHAGMTEIDTEVIWHLIYNLINVMA